jgi:hypothetical protein
LASNEKDESDTLRISNKIRIIEGKLKGFEERG